MKKKILIVDDDPRNIFALRLTLQARGFKVVSATNAMTALQLLQEDPTETLVLMDMMMPEMDGYEAVGKIRDNAVTAAVPVIAVTAQAMPEDREKCLDAGAQDYVTKPIDVDRLIEAIEKLS